MYDRGGMRWVIGVDEVGRGPLAGPVSVGACMLPVELNEWSLWEGLKDSKQLSEKKREEWYAQIEQDDRICFRVAHSTAAQIDEEGIVPAIRSAALRAVASLGVGLGDASIVADRGIVVSGGWHQEQFTKGDEHIPVIALASIMAKVTRDRLMVALGKEYPLYGFEKHKGYGSKQHQGAILQNGPIEGVHRKLFIRGIMNRKS